ncbi:peptide deformylase [Aequorivita sp. F47161]|uniref:Peptide deformylase n=1 Tax=Aequorivita vitellina TaxID=2874475 RepID=A0A9X1QWE6_9FLAO|nr:peptide deformylase [Aequorivita vitellina]MCG2419550.1 peptide deformylase [Aequorivita vitellina]MCZ4318740.1 peptide deformylase [Aequorivita viscosa]
MILPIIAYGDPVLRKETKEISKDYPNLDAVISNMFETMYEAHGIGLAAPQVNMPIRLFIVDATPFEDDEDLTEEERKFVSTFKKVFINAQIVEESGDEWAFNEGCLSIPDVREDVFRQPNITIEYLDENFKKHKENFSGIVARIIQHEYDHIEGILFTDKLSPLKKRLIKSKLTNISKGKVGIDYKMKFPNAKKKR